MSNYFVASQTNIVLKNNKWGNFGIPFFNSPEKYSYYEIDDSSTLVN